MKVTAFNSGQFGDLIINVAGAKIFKDKYPEKLLYMNVAKKYNGITDLLQNNKYIDGIQEWEGYDNWPTEHDRSIIDSGEYDLVGHPMNPHKDNWHKLRHQTCEVAYQNNIISLEECKKYKNGVQIELAQLKNLPDFKSCIAFFPFAGWYNQNNTKKLSTEKAQEIVDALIKNGHKVLQLGGLDEPHLKGAEKYNTSIVDSVRNMLGCKCLIHTDSFIAWAASGYQFPQIGLYNNSYYGEDCVKNIQPVNPNAQYISENSMDNVKIDDIMEKLKEI